MTLHTNDVLAPEREKYKAIWSKPEYHAYSPGKENVARFIDLIKPAPGETLIDLGCGAGVAGRELARHGLLVDYLDFVDALERGADRKRFIELPLWGDWRIWRRNGWDYGFCCDVMEHVPPEYTMLCIARVIENCRTAWFQIANDIDLCGNLIGQPLHLTVQPFAWWRDHIASLGTLLEARDLCGESLFVVRRK